MDPPMEYPGQSDYEQMQARIAELEAIVATLYTCGRLVDGKVVCDKAITPGMILFVAHPDSGTILSWQPEVDTLRLKGPGDSHWTIRPFQCFDSREAAEAQNNE